jgi:hypothetical protein
MNSAPLTWFTIGAILIYLVSQDRNVYEWLVLQSKSIRVWFARQWFLIRYNPDSPWVRWEIDRNARKLAQEILKENQSDDL